MVKWAKCCMGIAAGFLLVLGMEQLFSIRSEDSLFSNSVTAVLVFGMASYIAYRMLEDRADRRTWLLSFGAAGMFAAFLCMGHSLNYVETVWRRETFTALLFFLPFLTLLCKSGILFVGKYRWEISPQEVSAKRIRLYAGLLLLAWLPALLASWPGLYGYDSGHQLNQYWSGNLNSHHPIPHTLLLGVTMQIGVSLFDSAQMGALLYTILQMLAMAWILAVVVYKFERRGAPRWFCYVVLAFYGLHPVNSLMSLAATKDTLFSGFVILLVFQLLEVSEDPETYFSSGKKLGGLFIHLLAVLFFRNNAFHTLLLFVPFFLWTFRKYWKKAAFVLCGSLVLYSGVTGPGYKALGIEKGDPREMCSVLMQTAARAYNLVNLDLTEEEKEGFYTVIPEEGLYAYLPHFADPVKAYFDGNGFVEDPGPFLKAWFSVGKRHTKIYADAILSHTLGYWYPGAMLPDQSGLVYLEYGAGGNGEELSVELKPVLSHLSRSYEDMGNNASHQHIPAVAFFFSVGTFVWVLLAGCLVLIREKRYGALLPLLPLVLYLGTLLLGPVVKIRYAYPIIVCLPIIVYWMFIKEKRNG